MKTNTLKQTILFAFFLLLLPAYFISSHGYDFVGYDFARHDFAEYYYGGERLYHFGFISGSSQDKMVLNEDQYFTREQLAAVILSINGLQEEALQKNLTPKFKDLNDISVWARPLVAYCSEKKLMNGSAGFFKPQKPVTGKELGAVLLRTLGYHDVEWNDVEKKLEELGIPAFPSVMKRGTAFNYIWKAITKPITPDGRKFALQTGKVTESDLKFAKDYYDRNSEKSYRYISNYLINGVRFALKDSGTYDIYDSNGKILFESIDIVIARENRVLIHSEHENMYYVLDHTGIASQFPGDNFTEHEEGMFAITNSDGYILMNRNLQPISHIRVDYIGYFHDGVATVRKDGKWGAIDKTGEIVIDTVYDYLSYFSEGLATYRIDSSSEGTRYGVIDKTGKIVFVGAAPGSFREGFAYIDGVNPRYIDKHGKVLEIQHNKDLARASYFFNNGYAFAYEKNFKNMVFFDRTGKVVNTLPYYTYEGKYFDKRILTFRKEGYMGAVNHMGRIIIDPIYSDIVRLGDNLIAVEQKAKWEGGKWALFSGDGKQISDFVYTNLMDTGTDGGYPLFKKDEVYTVVDHSGNIVYSFETGEKVDKVSKVAINGQTIPGYIRVFISGDGYRILDLNSGIFYSLSNFSSRYGLLGEE